MYPNITHKTPERVWRNMERVKEEEEKMEVRGRVRRRGRWEVERS